VTTPPADPSHFLEAVRVWRARVPVSDTEFAQLEAEAQRRAFTVAGVAQAQLVADVWRALDSAIASGSTFQDFKREVGAKLTDAWGGERPWRLETIFRTNVQTAYGAGRARMQAEPAIRKRRPYLKYSSVLDARTSPICKPLGGTVLPVDHPFWASHQPPLHFGCRSTTIALTTEQAQAAGVAEEAPEVEPQEGFGRTAEDLQPDLSNFPEPLRRLLEERLAQGPK